MSEIITLGIRLVIDGKEAVGEIKGNAEAIKALGGATRASNDTARESNERYVASLRKQADTLGMTKTQTLAYEASQLKLTEAEKKSVVESIKAIDAYDKKQAMLGRVRLAASAAGTMLATALVAGLTASVSEAARAEQAHLKLEAVLRATGNAAGFSKEQLDAQAEALKRRTGIDDDQVRNSMAVLLTFRQVSGRTFTDTMTMAADLSKLLGQDLQSSVLMLGKALEDPETGLTALRRAGVSFNDAQKDTIKEMVATGRHAEALDLILQTMRQQGIDGVAEAMNKGYVGAFNNAKLATDDFFKALGQTEAVRVPVIAFLDAVAERVKNITLLIQQPDWQNFGLNILASNPATHALSGAAGQALAIKREIARLEEEERTKNFRESPRSAIKGAEEQQRDDAIAAAFGITPQGRGGATEAWTKGMADQQKTIDRIIEGFWKKQESAAESAARSREQFVVGLEKEAATLGMTKDQLREYEIAQMKLSEGDQHRARAAAEKISAYNAEQERLKGVIKQTMDRVTAEEEADRKGEEEWQKKMDALKNRLKQVDDELLSEEERERERHTRQLADLITANENELITDGEMIARRQAMEVAHQAKLKEIRKRNATELQRFTEMNMAQQTQTILGMMLNLTSGVAQQSRAMFELNKAAGIANALIKGYESINNSYAFGSKFAGPFGGAAMAALAAVATFAQVRAIANTQFNGGGAGIAPSIAGTAPATPVTPVGEPVAPAPTPQTAPTQAEQAPRRVDVFLHLEGRYDRPTAEAILESLSELSVDGFPTRFHLPTT